MPGSGLIMPPKESATHLFLKAQCLARAHAAGWEALPEQPGSTPDGQPWRAETRTLRCSPPSTRTRSGGSDAPRAVRLDLSVRACVPLSRAAPSLARIGRVGSQGCDNEEIR